MNKALFLDRDGVINEDEGYLFEIEKCRFVDGIFDLVKAAQDKGYLPIVVTNQSGIARGYYKVEDMILLHKYIEKEFRIRGVKIVDFFFSPYHPKAIIPELKKDSDCRKPKPGMFIQAIEKYNIDITKSIMVGDKPSDRIELEGLTSYILKSKYAADEYDIENLRELITFL